MERYYKEETLIEFVKNYSPNINGETTLECVERAIRNAPTADVVPRSEVDKARLKGYESGKRENLYGFPVEQLAQKIEELTKENESLAKSINEASELIRKLRSENNRLKAYDKERDLKLHTRLVRETEQRIAIEIIRAINGRLEKLLCFEAPKRIQQICYMKAQAELGEVRKKYIGEKQ